MTDWLNYTDKTFPVSTLIILLYLFALPAKGRHHLNTFELKLNKRWVGTLFSNWPSGPFSSNDRETVLSGICSIEYFDPINIREMKWGLLSRNPTLYLPNRIDGLSTVT